MGLLEDAQLSTVPRMLEVFNKITVLIKCFLTVLIKCFSRLRYNMTSIYKRLLCPSFPKPESPPTLENYCEDSGEEDKVMP